MRVLDRGSQGGHGWDGSRMAISRVEELGSRTVLGPFSMILAVFAVFGHFWVLGLGPWSEDVVWVASFEGPGSGSWAFVTFGRFWPFLSILGPFSYFLLRGRF